MSSISHEKLTSWLVPVLLTGAIGVLGWIASNINHMMEVIAVDSYRITSVEKRVDSLETRYVPSRP